jgi:DNA-binding transcriptional ArsR family regulator
LVSNAKFAQIAALAGDPARASMLHALMDGRALTATMLARVAGISPQTASGHLNQLTSAGLLNVEKQGRFRYHRIASVSVARMLESLMQLAAELEPHPVRRTIGPGEAALIIREARTCYDHLAGRLGVALADALVNQGFVELTPEAGILTETGLMFLEGLGIDTRPVFARRTKQTGRMLCRPCFDWSERRSHIGGAIGALICTHCMQRGWTAKIEGTRAVRVTSQGERALREAFGVRIK